MGDVDNREGFACVGAEVYKKLLYLLFNFAMNTKFLYKIKFIKEKLNEASVRALNESKNRVR